MEHLKKLLNIDRSNLAWVLRLGLRGLQAQLEEALKKEMLEKDVKDPGIEECRKLLKELDNILEPPLIPTTTVSDSPFEPVSPPERNVASATLGEGESPLVPLSGTEELKLSNLREIVTSDRDLSEYLGEIELNSTNDDQLWNEIQRLLLRVPENLANSQADNLIALAAEVGASASEQLMRSLPFSRGELVYPGLTKEVEAEGLRLSTNRVFDPRLPEEIPEGELSLLAGVVSVCLQFIEIDPCLHHGLKSVNRFGVISLNSESERLKYITALITRFQRLVVAEKNSNPVEILRVRLDLDEAINSLVYLPPCDRKSWWGKLQQESRDTLKGVVQRCRDAGYKANLRPLWGVYADIRDLSKDDFELDSGGTPGEVSACLRVYAKIDDEVLPGRVLFRSLR